MQQPLDLILWDWNGTLLDDLDVCVNCLNRLLADHGYPQQYDLAHYRQIFGFPIQEYYVKAGFDFARHPYDLLAHRYMDIYMPAAAGCGLVPGAKAALDSFAAMGIPQAVLSASSLQNLERQVAERGVAHYFTRLLGLGNIYGASKVQIGVDFMRANHIDPARVLMLGDTAHDAEVAAAMGVRCILIAAGHHSRQTLEATGCPVVDSADQIPAML